jgi:hypothetical protein
VAPNKQRDAVTRLAAGHFAPVRGREVKHDVEDRKQRSVGVAQRPEISARLIRNRHGPLNLEAVERLENDPERHGVARSRLRPLELPRLIHRARGLDR